MDLHQGLDDRIKKAQQLSVYSPSQISAYASFMHEFIEQWETCFPRESPWENVWTPQNRRGIYFVERGIADLVIYTAPGPVLNGGFHASFNYLDAFILEEGLIEAKALRLVGDLSVNDKDRYDQHKNRLEQRRKYETCWTGQARSWVAKHIPGVAQVPKRLETPKEADFEVGFPVSPWGREVLQMYEQRDHLQLFPLLRETIIQRNDQVSQRGTSNEYF